jgi:hypothetical protein
MCYTISEHIARTTGEFGSKAIGIFIIRIFVIICFTIQYQIIGRPLTDAGIGRIIPAELKTAIIVAAKNTTLNCIVVPGK